MLNQSDFSKLIASNKELKRSKDESSSNNTSGSGSSTGKIRFNIKEVAKLDREIERELTSGGGSHGGGGGGVKKRYSKGKLIIIGDDDNNEKDINASSSAGYRDRASERRRVEERLTTTDATNFSNTSSIYGLSSSNTSSAMTDPSVVEGLTAEQTKFLGGDFEHTHLVKGLDYAFLQKVKAEREKEKEKKKEKEGGSGGVIDGAVASTSDSGGVIGIDNIQPKSELGHSIKRVFDLLKLSSSNKNKNMSAATSTSTSTSINTSTSTSTSTSTPTTSSSYGYSRNHHHHHVGPLPPGITMPTAPISLPPGISTLGSITKSTAPPTASFAAAPVSTLKLSSTASTVSYLPSTVITPTMQLFSRMKYVYSHSSNHSSSSSSSDLPSTVIDNTGGNSSSSSNSSKRQSKGHNKLGKEGADGVMGEEEEEDVFAETDRLMNYQLAFQLGSKLQAVFAPAWSTSSSGKIKGKDKQKEKEKGYRKVKPGIASSSTSSTSSSGISNNNSSDSHSVVNKLKPSAVTITSIFDDVVDKYEPSAEDVGTGRAGADTMAAGTSTINACSSISTSGKNNSIFDDIIDDEGEGRGRGGGDVDDDGGGASATTTSASSQCKQQQQQNEELLAPVKSLLVATALQEKEKQKKKEQEQERARERDAFQLGAKINKGESFNSLYTSSEVYSNIDTIERDYNYDSSEGEGEDGGRSQGSIFKKKSGVAESEVSGKKRTAGTATTTATAATVSKWDSSIISNNKRMRK